jgi:tetratricopeptide (TPR) repeat protein
MTKLAMVVFVLSLTLLTGGPQNLISGAANTVAAQEWDDQQKIDIYKRFVDNRIPNPTVAYQAARDFMTRYPKEKSEYSDYIKQWMMFYERDERKQRLPVLINEKNFVEAYKVGNQILTDEPDYLRTRIDLGYAGYLASSAKNDSFNTTALEYARRAIRDIESGKAPSDWAPFKGKDDTLAYLNYAVGFLMLKTTPDQSIDPLIKAVQYESDIKKTPSTYYFLAAAYESGPYRTLSTAFQTNYAGKPETPESKAALEKLNVVIDRMIDAYARAVAAAGSDPKTQQAKAGWMATLTNYWKFRHENSEAGLNEFIAAALSKPLPPKP